MIDFFFYGEMAKASVVLMGYNKKAGIVLMVASVLVAIFFFLISDCDYCHLMKAGWLTLFLNEFHIQLYLIDIRTKYVLFICLVTFALGLMYYLEVFNAPRKRAKGQAASIPGE